MGVEELIGVPLILFMIFVAPIWVVMHYRAQRQVSQGLTNEEKANLQALADKAEAMSERIQTLEAILDAEAPDWRNKV